MIRHLAIACLVLMFGLCVSHSATAEKLQLVNGSYLEGEPISWDTRGLVVKLSSGEFAPREAWTNFTQSALKILAANPRIKPLVEPYLEEEEEPETPKQAAPDLKLNPVPRLDRPNPKTSSVFASPISTLAIFILYLANIYAGLEISRYRRQPPALVCGIAAVAPVVGPILFLSLPTRTIIESEAQDYGFHQARPESAESVAAPTSSTDAKPEEPTDQGPAPAVATLPPPVIYRRPQTTFNRRFFETKMAGFLRLVPSEAEKDLLLCVGSTRGNFVGQRIIRIMPNELMLLVKKGDASSDVLIPFNEINEVQIRHKDLGAGSH